MSINAIEGFPLEDFSADAVRAQITEAQKVANGNGSEQEVAEAKIELEVCCPHRLGHFPSPVLTHFLGS
jgi:F-type H+-transporting ATPase subunit delta